MDLPLEVIVHKLLISWMEPKAWWEISRRHGLPARCLLSCWSFSVFTLCLSLLLPATVLFSSPVKWFKACPTSSRVSLYRILTQALDVLQHRWIFFPYLLTKQTFIFVFWITHLYDIHASRLCRAACESCHGIALLRRGGMFFCSLNLFLCFRSLVSLKCHRREHD